MKRLLFIIFASIAILAMFAQDAYYNVGTKREYLTIDSNTVVSFISMDKYKNIVVPRHLTMVDSFCSDGAVHIIYNVGLPKSKFDLNNCRYFPENLSITPCYRDDRGELVIPKGYISARLKDGIEFDKLKEIVEKMNLIIDGPPIMGSCYSLIVRPDKGLDPFKVSNQLLETGLFDFVEPLIYIKDILE